MKILKREFITSKDLEENADLFHVTLPDRISDEEAKEKQLKIYVNTDFKQVIGKEIYDFVFLKVTSRQVFNEHGEISSRVYIIILWTNDELIKAEMLQDEYFNGKWLKSLNSLSVLFMPRKDYLALIKSFQPKDDKLFYFDKIGIHKLNGKYYYAASNCAVTAEGINRDIRAIQEGFHLNLAEDMPESEIEKTKIIDSFIKYSSWSYDIFYPIHCIPILSVLQHFLKKQGSVAGGILWIDGKVGSGKTQLSMTMGDFFNRGSSHGLSSHVNSPKAKYNEICENLPKYRNAVFILDDIKKEESSRNRENSKNITDFLIRSIYKGKIDSPNVEGVSVDASAIINGEFFKEQASTVSRVLYLQIDNFLNQKENSAHFKEIQNDPYYLAKFMCLFLIWLLKKMEVRHEIENLYLDLENLKQQKNLASLFQGQVSGSRMIETVANFQIVSVVLDMFFKDSSIEEERRKEFLEKSKNALQELGWATYLRSLDYLPIFKQMLSKALPDLNIKDCRYGKKYLDYAENIEKNPDYYTNNQLLIRTAALNPTETSREDGLGLLGSMWLFGMQKDYDGILFKRDEAETLLIKKDVICRLLKEKIIEYNEKNPPILYPSQYTDVSILAKLADSRTIYGYKRDDGFRKIIKFPIFSINDNYTNEDSPDYIHNSAECDMVKINTDEIKCSHLSTSTICSLEDFYHMAEKFWDFKNHYGKGAIRKSSNTLQSALREMDRHIDLK